MDTIFKGIRPLDYVLAALLTGLGVFMMRMNMTITAAEEAELDAKGELVHANSTHSWWVVVLFLAVTLPILWRRRSMVVVVLVTAAALGLHIAAVGWQVRCGSGLPLSFALAYGVGRLSDRKEIAPTFLGVIGVQYLVLVRDSAVGLELLPFTAGIALVLAALGYGVRHLIEKKTVRDAERTLVAA